MHDCIKPSLGACRARAGVVEIATTPPRILAMIFSLFLHNARATPSPTYELGVENYRETYRETVNGNPYVMEQAPMIGLFGSIRLADDPRQGVKLSMRYAQGTSTYTGGLMAENGNDYGAIISSGQNRTVLDMRGVYEWTPLVLDHEVTPSIGLGYRTLVDHFEQAGPEGYKRVSRYAYLTLGLTTTYSLTANWKVTPILAYNLLIAGQAFADSNPPSTNQQNNGQGGELSCAFLYIRQDRKAFSIEPFVRYWKIGRSNMVQSGTQMIYEPDNTTREAGIRLDIQF